MGKVAKQTLQATGAVQFLVALKSCNNSSFSAKSKQTIGWNNIARPKHEAGVTATDQEVKNGCYAPQS